MATPSNLVKLLLVGNSGAGKTSIFERFVKNKFKSTYEPTFGMDFETKPFQAGDFQGKLQIWDTTGQERFRSITSAYYRGANVIMAVVKLKSEDSAEDFNKRAISEFKGWLSDIRNASDKVPVLLVVNGANSIPQTDKASIQRALLEYAQQNNEYQKIFFVSADTGEGVEALFTDACQIALTYQGIKLPQDTKITFNENTPQAVTSRDAMPVTELKQKRLAKGNLFGALWEGIWGLFSAVIGGVSTGIAVFIISNPLSLIFHILPSSDFKAWQKLICTLISPLLAVVIGLILAYEGAKEGWEKGIVSSFEWFVSELQKKDANGNKLTNFNHVIASWIILGLTAAVVLTVIFPPVGLAVMLPTMAATFGLSGMSTAVLAVIAGVATAAVLSAGYGLANLAFGGDAVKTMPAVKSTKMSDDQEQLLPKRSSTDGTPPAVAVVGPSAAYQPVLTPAVPPAASGKDAQPPVSAPTLGLKNSE